MYKKHYPPALSDDVWRLEKIGKDGSFHKKLNNAGIFTVEDFLRLVVKDQQKLRNVSLDFAFYIVNLGPSSNFLISFKCRSLGVACQTRCGRLS